MTDYNLADKVSAAANLTENALVLGEDGVKGVKSGPLFAGKNFIVNGGALVNQRVTAHTLVKDTYGICSDRFYGMATGTAVSAGTLTQATATALLGRTGCAFHFSGLTLTGTGIVYLRYRMEAKDAVKFIGQNASFSCKAYQDTGGAINYTVYVNKADAADNFTAVTAISNDTAQSVVDSTETDVKYESIAMGACGNGIEIIIKIECGAITTKNFYLTELQFELGSVATVFEHRNYTEELARCKRYFHRLINGNAQIASSGVCQDANTAWMYCAFPVEMRAAPSLAYSNLSHFALFDDAEQATMNTIAIARSSPRSCMLSPTKTASLTAGNGVVFYSNNASATLDFLAEL